MRKILVSLAAVFLLSSPSPAPAADPPAPGDRPGMVIAGDRVATATVEAVVKDTREVTLKAADGALMTFKAGPEVRNFDRIRVGDRVTASYFQKLAVFVAPRGGVPSASETESVERAAKGEKPAGGFTRNVNISATVEALDLAGRNITLRGPRGNTVTLRVGDNVRNLDRIKVGDMVVTEYTESVDIAVTKP